MNTIEDKITEEFADKLLKEYMSTALYSCEKAKRIMRERWVENGYIKQSNEEDIREELKRLQEYSGGKECCFAKKCKQLIKILEDKLEK